ISGGRKRWRRARRWLSCSWRWRWWQKQARGWRRRGTRRLRLFRRTCRALKKITIRKFSRRTAKPCFRAEEDERHAAPARLVKRGILRRHVRLRHRHGAVGGDPAADFRAFAVRSGGGGEPFSGDERDDAGGDAVAGAIARPVRHSAGAVDCPAGRGGRADVSREREQLRGTGSGGGTAGRGRRRAESGDEHAYCGSARGFAEKKRGTEHAWRVLRIRGAVCAVYDWVAAVANGTHGDSLSRGRAQFGSGGDERGAGVPVSTAERGRSVFRGARAGAPAAGGGVRSPAVF